jgi:hypothetical protein
MKCHPVPLGILVVGIVALWAVAWEFPQFPYAIDPEEVYVLRRIYGYDQPPLQPIVQLIVTTALLCASLFVIFSNRYTPSDRHWAYGTIGMLVGFWLNG